MIRSTSKGHIFIGKMSLDLEFLSSIYVPNAQPIEPEPFLLALVRAVLAVLVVLVTGENKVLDKDLKLTTILLRL